MSGDEIDQPYDVSEQSGATSIDESGSGKGAILGDSVKKVEKPSSSLPSRKQQGRHSLDRSLGSPAPQIYLQHGARGGRFSNSNPKSDIDWKVLRAKQLPGPGEYGNPGANFFKTGGGKFSTSQPKSDVDWVIYRASKLPAPGEYDTSYGSAISGGRFSISKPKSSLDWTIYNASKTPGPGQYDPDKSYKLQGGRFSEARPKTDVDWVIYKASRLPGPGQYDLDKGSRGLGGGKFSTANPKSDVDWQMLRSKGQPGPGQYDLNLDSRVSGGRLSTSKTITDVDIAIARARQTPGPGEYSHDITAISVRTAVIPHCPNTPTLTYEKPKHLTEIPAAARGKVKPKPQPLTPGKIGAGTKSAEEEGKGGKSGSRRSASAVGMHGEEAEGGKRGKGGGLSGAYKVRPRSSSPSRWYVSKDAAKAYGVSSEDYKAKKEKKLAGDAAKKAKGAGQHGKGRHVMSVSISPARVKTAAPVGRGEEEGGYGRGGLEREEEEGGVRGGRGDEGMSESAQKLFDMAMGSEEFRTMMRLYTGMDNPEEVIHKYATLWSNNAIAEATAKGGSSADEGHGAQRGRAARRGH